MSFLWGLLTFAGIVYVMITLNVILTNYRLPRAKIQILDNQQPPDEDQWARENGFVFLGNYLISITAIQTFISAWQYHDRPTFFCRYLVCAKNNRKISYDVVTEFADHIGLTTGSTKDGHFFPKRPGSYTQSFSKKDLDGRWAAHLEMENYLLDEGGAELIAIDRPIAELIQESIQISMRYVRTIKLWPFRGVYWFFIRRQRWHNLTIRQQREKGWIRLPQELTPDEKAMIQKLVAVS